jgi:hypothetical protein
LKLFQAPTDKRLAGTHRTKLGSQTGSACDAL